MNPDKYLPSLQKRIGIQLIALRKGLGYTDHEKFAYKYKITRSSYYKLESGKGNPTLKTLAKVLAVHNLTIEQFVASLPEAPDKPSRSPKK